MFVDWETNIVKTAILPRVIYRFSAISIKIPMGFFSLEEMLKMTLKVICNCKGTDIANTTSQNKDKPGGLIISMSKLITKSYSNQAMGNLHRIDIQINESELTVHK